MRLLGFSVEYSVWFGGADPAHLYFAQGALDGGLDIPHNEKRMVGYDKGAKKMDAETLSKYIYGGHVEEYMETMQEEEPEKYQAHFAKYIEAGVEPGEVEDLYKAVSGGCARTCATVWFGKDVGGAQEQQFAPLDSFCAPGLAGELQCDLCARYGSIRHVKHPIPSDLGSETMMGLGVIGSGHRWPSRDPQVL